jgi:hypothetical protein
VLAMMMTARTMGLLSLIFLKSRVAPALIFLYQSNGAIMRTWSDARMTERFNTPERGSRVDEMGHLARLAECFESLRAAMMLIFTLMESHIGERRKEVLMFFEFTTMEA